MRQLLFALWVFLPAGLANATPVFAARIPGLANLDAPLDFAKTWRHARIFGANKTWRGLIAGITVAILTVWLQQYLYGQSTWLQDISLHVDYNTAPVVLLGILLGGGALLGDAVESFFKRQRGVPSGKSWFPFDQTDYIVGGLLCAWPILGFTLSQALLIIIVWVGMHVVTSYIGYLVKLKDAPI